MEMTRRWPVQPSASQIAFVHRHVLSTSPLAENIIQQLPAPRSEMCPRGLLPHRQAEEDVNQQETAFSSGPQEKETIVVYAANPTALETLMDDSLSSLASPNIFQTDNRRLHPTLRYSRKQTLLEEGSLIFEDLAQFSASSSSASGGDVRDLTNLDAETYTSLRNVFTSSTPSRELTSFSSGAAQEQLKQHPPDGEENNRLHRDAETGVPNYLLPASHCVSADFIGPPKVATENITNDALKKEGHPFFQVESSLKGPETTLLPPPQPHPYSLVFSENLRGSDRLQQQHSPPPILPIQGSVDGPARDLRFGGSQSDGFVAEGRIETGFRSCLAEDDRLLLPPSVVHPSTRLYPPGEVCGRVNSGPVECVPPSLFSLPSASSTPWQIPPYLQPQPSLPELSGAGGPSGFGWPRPLEPNSPR
nr:unnamed protein product [Spirometra erinaceieuropaei]